MQKDTFKYRLALHIFRRDLRLDDNNALIEALGSAHTVIPCFIFDKRQIEHNAYKGKHCIEFMAQSLKELNEDLERKQSKLYFFYGIAEDIVEKLIKDIKIDAVFFNRDYTPFSKQRDLCIEKICENNHVDFHCYADALLNEPEQVLKQDQKPYIIFTHAYKKARGMPVRSPRNNLYKNYYQGTIAFEDKKTLLALLQNKNPNLFVKGGRQEALKLLKEIQHLKDYSECRNFPAVNGTTKLSAHNKFGTLSIREFYAAINKAFDKTHTLITELYWRDFFTHITFHYPYVFGKSFHEEYDKIVWSKNANHFQAWCEGKTGFPIVDAGMRELNTTGYMHNRVRMIVASFLTKDLHIDWRLGEKYFAQQLVDYDPAVNNGNWQWAASTGCDAQPYFRIFNPWLQQQKFDPDCLYIKRYIPELSGLLPKEIHAYDKNQDYVIPNYPRPIVNHSIESQYAKRMYKYKA